MADYEPEDPADVWAEAIKHQIRLLHEQALEDKELDAEGYYREIACFTGGLELPRPEWPFEHSSFVGGGPFAGLRSLMASNGETRLKAVLPALLNFDTWEMCVDLFDLFDPDFLWRLIEKETEALEGHFQDFADWRTSRLELAGKLHVLTDLAELHAKAGRLATIGDWDGLKTFVDVRTFFQWALAQGFFVPPAIQGELMEYMGKEELFELAREYARSKRRKGATVAEIAQALSKEDNPDGVFKFSRADVALTLRPDMKGKPKEQLAAEGKHLATGRRKTMTC